MAFSFGSTTPAPAPAGGAFSFGGTPAAAPAPAISGFGGFGGTPAAGAGAGAFSFGGSTPTAAAAPATGGLFGAPAPAASSFSFGGSTPAPATPAAGSSFSFGSPAPAAGSSLFGNTPAAAAAPASSLWGTPSFAPQQQAHQQQAQAQAQQSQHITANTPFKSLPQPAQKIIEDIHNLTHQHNQTMSSVSTMIPSLLTDADKAAGTQTPLAISPLSLRMTSIQSKLISLKEDLDGKSQYVNQVFMDANGLYQLTHECGVYPVQNIAARRGIALPQQPHAARDSHSETVKKLNAMLHENATHVDRLEGMPSIYLWKVMEDMQQRIEKMGQRLIFLKKELEGRKNLVLRGSGENATEELSLAMQNQVESLIRVADVVGRMNEHMDGLRMAYKQKVAKERFQKGSMGYGGGGGFSTGGLSFVDNGSGFDPFLDANQRESEEERRLELEVRKRTIQASANIPSMNAPGAQAPQAPAPPAGGLFGTPAPVSGGLFGASPAPVSGGLFGSSPAPVAGGLFGASPAAPSAIGGFGSPSPAPASGGFFGSAPAAAPAGGGLFGSTAGGGLFGSTPAAAPAPSAFGASAFGATPAPAPAGGLFGSTPAPAPFGGGALFGATPTAAPVGGALFDAPAAAGGAFGSAGASTPASSKSRRRAGRRR